MRISKNLPNTEVYNITIEGSESAFDTNSGVGGAAADGEMVTGESGDFATFASETKKHGSDSSSEVPDDVKGFW